MNSDYELLALKQRVERLERAAQNRFSEYVEGWANVGRILGVHAMTCRRRYEAGKFPEPCDRDALRWRLSDLRAYAEGNLSLVTTHSP